LLASTVSGIGLERPFFPICGIDNRMSEGKGNRQYRGEDVQNVKSLLAFWSTQLKFNP